MGSSPCNRSAQAGQNQHDSIETSTSLPGDRPDLRSAPSTSARAQIAIRGLMAPAPNHAPIVPQREEKTPRSRCANHTRFRSGPGQA